MSINIFDRAPDFVNEFGVKWWAEESATQYAKRKGLDCLVWAVDGPPPGRAYVITDEKSVIYESQSLEAIGCRLDMMALIKRSYQ